MTLNQGTGFIIYTMGGQKMTRLIIGELAKQSNVNIATVSYYEKRGLIAKPPRTESGYRMFSHNAVTEIKMVKHAQELGFTLEEIKKILSIYRVEDYFPTKELYQISKEKIIEIDEKVAQLKNLKSLLENAMKNTASELPDPKESCPLLKKLSDRRNE